MVVNPAHYGVVQRLVRSIGTAISNEFMQAFANGVKMLRAPVRRNH